MIAGYVLHNMKSGPDMLRSTRLYLGLDGSPDVWNLNLSKIYDSAKAATRDFPMTMGDYRCFSQLGELEIYLIGRSGAFSDRTITKIGNKHLPSAKFLL